MHLLITALLPALCELWFPGYRERAKLKALKKGHIKAEGEPQTPLYPFYFNILELFSWIDCVWSLFMSLYYHLPFDLSTFSSSLITPVEVPLQKRPKIEGWVHFQIMVLALSVMNELRKGKRFVLFLNLLESICWLLQQLNVSTLSFDYHWAVLL